MRSRYTPLALLALLFRSTLADVEVTSPAAGAQIPAGTLSITWQDSGVAPALSALTSYTIQLVVGGNDASTQTPLITCANAAAFTAGSTASCVVPAGVAGSTVNGYFLKFTSVASEGGTVINYSNRFTMTAMTGVTPATAVTAITELNGATAGPPTVNGVSNGNAAGAAPAAGAGAYTVPYNLQTGLTKYAPMQPVPPTKITAKTYSPLYPTSAVTIAKTWLPRASIQTTVTLPQTFSVSSMENTAAAQAGPTGDMAKFLARWKD